MADWTRGAAQPTLRQLESFARIARAPIGFLFLPEPPQEKRPIPDFRKRVRARPARPSPDLLETIYVCQQRQDWYRDYATQARQGPRDFVGSANLRQAPVAVASRIRRALGVDLDARAEMASWAEARRTLMEQAEVAEVLVMCRSVVMNNNSRRLDPEEFRGFTLSDSLAPLVFVNAADSQAAQMFTLAHELGHVWLGQSALGDEQIWVTSICAHELAGGDQ